MMDKTCVDKELLKDNFADVFAAGYGVLSNNYTDCKMKLVSPSEEYWTYVYV